MSDDTRLSRRRLLLAGAGGIGALALAGCTEPNEQAAAAVSVVDEEPPTPPSGDPDNEYWQYLVTSLDYQNRQIHAQSQGIAALLDDAGLSDGEGDNGS